MSWKRVTRNQGKKKKPTKRELERRQAQSDKDSGVIVVANNET